MSIRIVVDSTADMPESLKERVTIIPLSVSFGQDTYIDGVTIDHAAFYQKLASSHVFPTTSQPSPDAYMQVYEEARQSGDTLVVLCVSSGVSGTYQSARIAAEDYKDNVYVVDTLHGANGLGILTEYALDLVSSGKSAQEIVKAIEEARENVRFMAVVDTLSNLQKGGRIPKSLAIAGTLLSIKPVLYINNGVLEMLGKARGLKQAYNLLNKEISDIGIDFDKPYLLAYSGVTDEPIRKYLAHNPSIWEKEGKTVRCVPICSVVGAHAGLGAIAVAFFEKKSCRAGLRTQSPETCR